MPRLFAVLVGLTVLGLARAGGYDPAAWTHGPVSETAVDGEHDDLLTAGLGLTGLRLPIPPPVANPLEPTAAELRRLAYHSNYRALLDLSAAGGFADLYGFGVDAPAIAGVEYRTLGHRRDIALTHVVVVQVPDTFSNARPCLVVAPVSGSRGVYGAVGTVGAWALRQRCAVAYTDKGAGNWVAGLGRPMAIDGRFVTSDPEADLEPFSARADAVDGLPSGVVALKHAHSSANPEAHWGDMTLQAVALAWELLQERHGLKGGHEQLTVLAASISNGGGAVLHAAERDTQGWIDGVVASEPTVAVGRLPMALMVAEGDHKVPLTARSLYDYGSYAAVFEPCAALAVPDAPLMSALSSVRPLLEGRCRALVALGLLPEGSVDELATEALAKLEDYGLHSTARPMLAFNTYANLWASVAGVYASAYAGATASDRLCGVGIGAVDASGQLTSWALPLAATIAGTGSGVPPTAGLEMLVLDEAGARRIALAAGVVESNPDFGLGPMLCLRGLLQPDLVQGAGATDWRERFAAGHAAVRRTGNPGSTPVLIVHGQADGLVYVNHSSRAYLASALANGLDNVRYIEVTHAQHFDAVLALPGFNTQFVPLSLYFDRAMDRMLNHLTTGRALPPSQLVRTNPRAPAEGTIPPLSRAHVPDIAQEPAAADAITFADRTLHIPGSNQ